MNNLSEQEREIILKNWEIIKSNTEKNKIYESIIDSMPFCSVNYLNFIELNIIKEENIISINIDKKAKAMKFIYDFKDKTIEKDELISEPNLIPFYTNYFKMQHPVYKVKENENEKETNISVDNSNCNDIFNDPTIKIIFDDRFQLFVNKEEFRRYKKKIKIKVSDYYTNFSNNIFSKLIEDDHYIDCDDRDSLSKFINELENFQNIIILAGCQKIGLSLTILYNSKFHNTLYMNFEELFELKKASDKRKNVFRRFFDIFDTYEEYKNFINKHIFKIKGYDDILEVILNYIKTIEKNYTKKNIYICLDNYDDYLVGNTKLSDDYIEKIYKTIKNSKIKIIILGHGLYISKMLIKYFYKPLQIDNYILVKYIINILLFDINYVKK